jgi:hypothetical protein
MDAASHGHDSHGSHAVAEESLPEHPPPGSGSERYELEDLFRGEAPENLHAVKVMGIVVLSVLLLLALAYPVFVFLKNSN